MVAEALDKELVSCFSLPLKLHSDQDRNFESAVFQVICKVLGILKKQIIALYLQFDVIVERMNLTIGKYL